MGNNHISDLTLRKLKKLETLYAWNNQIKNIFVLKQMGQLVELNQSQLDHRRVSFVWAKQTGSCMAKTQ